MSLPLRPHPSTPAPEGLSLEAVAWRTPDAELVVMYEIKGDISGLAIPTPVRPVRADGLWKHACMEAFVRAGDEAGYHEINISPGGEWAAYRFDAYRDGMRLAEIPEPFVDRDDDEAQLMISARVRFPAMAAAPLWRVGLSAVIETREGAISYWALAHPPGKPDFHHADGFVLELAREQP